MAAPRQRQSPIPAPTGPASECLPHLSLHCRAVDVRPLPASNDSCSAPKLRRSSNILICRDDYCGLTSAVLRSWPLAAGGILQRHCLRAEKATVRLSEGASQGTHFL